MSVKAIFLLFYVARAFAASQAEIEQKNLDRTGNAASVYAQDRPGSHYEWTDYGHRYDKANYGHRFEWTDPGLSSMSVCEEVDGETGGQRFHRPASDVNCPAFEAEYLWNIPFEGTRSRCLKRDAQTHGKKFVRVVDDSHCAKPATIYAWTKEEGSEVCDEVDAETEGKVYRKAAHSYLCAHTLDVSVAFGRKEPALPRARTGRAPASTPEKAALLELDPDFQEELSVHDK